MRWAWEAAESWSMSVVEGEGGGCGIVGFFCPVPLVSGSEWLFTSSITGWKVAGGFNVGGASLLDQNDQVVMYCEI